VRGAYEALYHMRPAVGPSYCLFVERSADPINNSARPHWPLPTVHTTRAQNQTILFVSFDDFVTMGNMGKNMQFRGWFLNIFLNVESPTAPIEDSATSQHTEVRRNIKTVRLIHC